MIPETQQENQLLTIYLYSCVGVTRSCTHIRTGETVNVVLLGAAAGLGVSFFF